MSQPLDVAFALNGVDQTLSVEPRRVLADVLREAFDLRSVHLGCEQGVCGSCIVLVDGEPAISCLLLAVQVHGRSVTTLEGVAQRPRMQRLQFEFHDHFALQCGFCTPGMLMNLYAYLEELGDSRPPTESDVRDRLRGNLCRCTGYQSIVEAALAVASGTTPPEESAPGGSHL